MVHSHFCLQIARYLQPRPRQKQIVMLLHELSDAHPCSKNASLTAWIADSNPVSSPIVSWLEQKQCMNVFTFEPCMVELIISKE